jgi:tetratricopeptide (TPR) repeat protein
MMLPFQSDNGLLTLFSFAHYVEFFNSQMLCAGIGFLVWLTTLALSIVHKIKYDAKLWFFQIASLSVSGLIFVFRMDRGSGDWDICSFAPIVYNAANACFLISVYEQKLYRNIKYGILMIAGFSTLHTSAWIFTNKSDASIQWLERAFSTDPANYYKTSFSNESMLTAVYTANNLREYALKWGKKAYSKYPNDPRTGYNYALQLLAANRLEEGYPIMEKLLKSFPAYALPYVQLIAHYLNIKDYNALYRVLLQLEQVYAQAPEAFTSRLSREQLDQYFGILSQMKSQHNQ